MGLLNKSDKTKILRSIDDISKNIKIRIADVHPWNMTSEQEALCRKLATLVSDLEVSVMYEEWTIDTVPTLGLEYTKELLVIGRAVQDQYIFFFRAIGSNNHSTSYKISITLDIEKMNGINPRVLQGGFIRNGKWECDAISGTFKKYNNGTSKQIK